MGPRLRPSLLAGSLISFFWCSCGAPATSPGVTRPTDSARPVDVRVAPPPASSPPPASAAAPNAAVAQESAPDASAADAAEAAVVHRPPVKLPGPCVDPIGDATKRSRLHVPPVIDPVRVDIDDDGNEDWIVTTEADATAYGGYVYVARGTCAHWVGAWRGSAPAPIATSTRGLRDLEEGTPCKPTCCPTETVRTLKFDGNVYRKVSERIEQHNCMSRRSERP